MTAGEEAASRERSLNLQTGWGRAWRGMLAARPVERSAEMANVDFMFAEIGTNVSVFLLVQKRRASGTGLGKYPKKERFLYE